MRSHYFNRIPMKLGSPEDIDFTKSQFADQDEYLKLRQQPIMKPREYLLPSNSSYEQAKFIDRYKMLRLKVAEILANNHPIFQNSTYNRCLSLALESNCKKGKYGCLVMYEIPALYGGNRPPISTFNRQLAPLKGWCEPECVRLHIPSRTESMIGECGHAEELAIAEALSQGFNLNKCSLYVAGFRSNGLAYIKDEPEFTCLRCAIQIYLHRVGIVYVPTKNGWIWLSAKECIKTAKKYALKEKALPSESSK